MTTTQATRTAIDMYVGSRTWGIGEPSHTIPVDVKWTKRGHGMGWYLTRRDNGHILGMVAHDSDNGGWIAYALLDAFWPAGSDIMARTNRHPMFDGEALKGRKVDGGCRTLEEAGASILYYLGSRRAEGVEDLIEAMRTEGGWAR